MLLTKESCGSSPLTPKAAQRKMPTTEKRAFGN